VSPDQAVDSAVANARLSGAELDEEWVALLRRYAHGELTIDELIDLALEGGDE
jgi:antitoxin VbhA-like protein